MRSALAIYITLFAVAVMAIAQILYFRLVLARRRIASEEAPETGLLYEPIELYIGVQLDDTEPSVATEPVPAAEPACAAEPVLLAA